ncbi:MAG: HK97 family phage prohead protease [Elusimicrobiales bacterium]|jgi:HK97 family phage prohead protease
METKTTPQRKVPFTFPIQLIKAVEENGEFHIVGYAATSDLDLQGDIITEEALQGSSLDLLQNSTVLLNHDLKLPIGKVTKVQFDQHGLLIDALISQTEPEIIQKIKEGVLNKFSIRGQVLERERKFMPELERTVNVILRMTLVEVSLVSVPANPEARAIGWYIAKALRHTAEESEGGDNMSDDEITIEQIRQKEDGQPAAQEPSKPEEPKPPEAAAPPAEPETPPQAAETQKAAPPPNMGALSPVMALLDKIAAMGGQAAPIAEQVKAMLMNAVMSAPQPAPAAPKGVSKAELGKIIAGEVARQVEAAIKSIPTARKGIIEPAPETDGVKKEFDSLSPEKKLKVALAMQKQ